MTATLSSLGLATGHVNANDLFLPVSTTVGRAEVAFDVSIHRYRLASKRIAYADTAAPRLPDTIASDIVGIVGLSNLFLPHPVSGPYLRPLPHETYANRPAVPTPAKVAPDTSGPTACSAAADDPYTYTATQLAHSYGLDTGAYAGGRLGAGETIAVYEDTQFLASDIAAYDSCYGISPTVNVKLVGSKNPGINADLFEAELDIEGIEGLAPDATIDVYETADNITGASFPNAIAQVATDDSAQVLSISYGNCEPELPGALLSAFHFAFSQMAAQGQSAFVAAGDSGSEGCDVNYNGSSKTLAVDYPASDPYITAVGGTDLWGTSVPPPESGWNDHQIDNSYYTGGGGGISTFWPMPSWQQTVGVNSDSSGTPCDAPIGTYCREVPDVSAMAGGNTGYGVYCSDDAEGCESSAPWTFAQGTSAASPLWAAVTALANEGCSAPAGFLNPALYAHEGDLNDIGAATYDGYTITNNDATGTNAGLYPITTGYDMATGLGTPTAALFSPGALCDTTPGAPTIGTATAGNASAIVTFIPPTDNGGASISSYTVTASDSTTPSNGGETASGSASPITVTGLTNGDSYTFTVTATSSAGTGPASLDSNAVTPSTVPGAPTIGSATAANASASVAFTPPTDNGGASISSYTVTASDSTTPSNGGETASGSASPITVTGLTNGDSYTFTVAATNTNGTGAASGASNSVIPSTVPGVPTIGTATAGNGQATVTFTPPTSNGGASISSYTVTAADSTNPLNGGETASGSGSPITVTGLTNGDSYTFTVTATNTNGTGAASGASNSVTPLAPPTITSFSPTSGPVGTVVTIKGTNLSDATKVTFKGKAATITADSATKIKVKVPGGAKTGYIQVTTPSGTTESVTKFKVT